MASRFYVYCWYCKYESLSMSTLKVLTPLQVDARLSYNTGLSNVPQLTVLDVLGRYVIKQEGFVRTCVPFELRFY